MAFLEVLIPQLVNCAQNSGQAFAGLMDQDWNHWKLQFQSYMDDIKETETNTEPTRQTCGQSCGQSCGNRGAGCGDRDPATPLDALHQIWNQFSGQQRSRSRPFTQNNKVENSGKKFTIKLDVENYEPNEIEVKIVDKDIVVTAEHPERTDRLGRVSRRFQRKFELPSDVETDSIVSTMTPKGVLIIEGLKKSQTPNESAEVVIPVIREEKNYENDHHMD